MPRPTPFSRRSALALPPTLLLALTAGCDDSPAGTQERTERDPDEGLLASVVASAQELRAAVTIAPQGMGTAAALGALVLCLDAHLELLAPDTDGPTPAARPAEPGAAREDDSADERPRVAAGTEALALGRGHLTLLTDAAARAESGAFARVLACAAAGIGQHLAPLEQAQKKDPS